MSGPIPNQDLAVLRSLAARGNKEARLIVRTFDTLRASDAEVVICRATTTANRTLSGLTNTVLDSITPVDGDVILVKEQSAPAENGLYLAHASAWTRLLDDKGAVVMRAGMTAVVNEGSTLGDTKWVLTTDDPIVVGTTGLVFSAGAGVPGSIDTADLADLAVETAKIALLAVDTGQLAALAVETAKIALLAVDTGQLADGAATIAKLGPDVLFGDDLGAPDVLTDNHFLLSVNMQATAYTLDNTTLPADNPPRNLIVTHTQVGGVSDTLGDLVADGTDFEDNVIQETITISDGGVATGVKAFKTVTALTTASWVIDTTEDTIEVGLGNLLGLSQLLTAADQVFLAILAGVTLAPDAITVSASLIEENTVDLNGGTYDSSKEARVMIKQA